MYVDSSAILAILLGEPDAPQLLAEIAAAPAPFTSIVTKVESSLALMKISTDDAPAGQMVSDLLADLGIAVVAAEPGIFDGVMKAATRYGRRSGHPAKLNFGDCFSYAFARQAGVPLLYKANDFAQTDLA